MYHKNDHLSRRASCKMRFYHTAPGEVCMSITGNESILEGESVPYQTCNDAATTIMPCGVATYDVTIAST